jgi:hypothetical protein
MSGIGVVHLIHHRNGIAPFERFVTSYLQHAAGVQHQLIFAFKGFEQGKVPAEYESIGSAVSHQRMFVQDEGFDLDVYFAAVAQLDFEYFCFLNSFSRILVPGWLAKLHRWAAASGIGLAGATASWQSIASESEGQAQRVRRMSARRRIARKLEFIVELRRKGILWQQGKYWLMRKTGIWNPAQEFSPFPNYHLRTNTFMSSKSVLQKIDIGSIDSKLSAYRFESGTHGLTNQVRRMGLRVVVVGSDDQAYDQQDWHLSNTFWQSKQENLLVSDNQTELYFSSDASKRDELAHYAWGNLARPAI